MRQGPGGLVFARPASCVCGRGIRAFHVQRHVVKTESLLRRVCKLGRGCQNESVRPRGRRRRCVLACQRRSEVHGCWRRCWPCARPSIHHACRSFSASYRAPGDYCQLCPLVSGCCGVVGSVPPFPATSERMCPAAAQGFCTEH